MALGRAESNESRLVLIEPALETHPLRETKFGFFIKKC